ncbi:MAG: YceI family protein [Saprospiraceae bacterium]
MYQVFSFAVLFLLSTGPIASQRYFTRDANVYFNATSPLEKIEATSKTGTCVLDTQTGQMEWKVLIKGFQMEKALMQEHFNENYMESSKYPTAQFKGTITNLAAVNFKQDGKYGAQVKGQLILHGVTKDVDLAGTIKVNAGTITLFSSFQVLAADYGITIPALMRDKIAQVINVSVEGQLQPMK